MAYNGYFPQSYYGNPPYYGAMQAMPQQQNQPTAGAGINWVQGEQAAKSYPVASGQSVLLMDAEASVFYIKSTDQSGMPLPLRIFHYTEQTAGKQDPAATSKPEYVTRAEFNEFKDEILLSKKGIRKPTFETEGEG